MSVTRLQAFARRFRRRRPQYAVVWWPDIGQLPLPDMPELIGPFRSADRALAVRDRIRSEQRRPEKMAHVTVISPPPCA